MDRFAFAFAYLEGGSQFEGSGLEKFEKGWRCEYLKILGD